MLLVSRSCFFFNDTATTEIYTLSLHDALPISRPHHLQLAAEWQDDAAGWAAALLGIDRTGQDRQQREGQGDESQDRKSTRLNSSHANISYAVFCLKKKKNNMTLHRRSEMHTCY